MNRSSHYYFRCDCETPDHHFVVVHYEDDDGWEQVSLQVKLDNWQGFWGRLVTAFRFLFNLDEKKYSYAEIIMTPEDCVRLQKAMERLNDR